MASSSFPTPPAVSLGEYSGTGIIVCASIFIAVQILVVGLRLFTKYITKAIWGWDDYMLVPALIAATVLDATFIYMVQYCGLGYHELPLLFTDFNKVILFAKLTLLTTSCIVLAMSFPRWCTYFIYLRIFTSRPLRITTWVLLGSSVVYATIALILNLTVCVPISAIWTPGLKAECFNKTAWWGYGTIPVVFYDIITMALPVSTIMRLSVPLGERVSLLLTFLAYGFGTIAEIVRISIFITKDATSDVTWVSVPLTYATICEVGSYVIAACIPGLRPLYLYAAGKGSYSRKGSKPQQSGKTPLRYAGSYQLDSRQTAPPSTSIGNTNSAIGRGKDGYYQSQSEESLVIADKIKVTRDVTVS